MNDDRLKDLGDLSERLWRALEQTLHANIKCCVNCISFDTKNELCTDRINCPEYPARPPARIIAFGCNRYMEEPPF
jgi:hypothetical protein